MSFSRRSIFGFLAGGTAAIAAEKVSAKTPAPAPAKPEYFVGQIRAVHSHYEARSYIDPGHSHSFHTIGPSSHTHAFMTPAYYTTAVAVQRYEQWDGTEWLPIGAPRP